MKGYRIYLTKSNEVAHLLGAALTAKIGKENIGSVSIGMVHDNCRIPELYHGTEYFYCIVEYQELKQPKYEIIFA